MSFSIIIFLYIYYGLLMVWALFSLIAVYHMVKFGFRNFTTFATTFIYVAVSIIVLAVSYNYINQVDWHGEISMLQLFNQANLFKR